MVGLVGSEFVIQSAGKAHKALSKLQGLGKEIAMIIPLVTALGELDEGVDEEYYCRVACWSEIHDEFV